LIYNLNKSSPHFSLGTSCTSGRGTESSEPVQHIGTSVVTVKAYCATKQKDFKRNTQYLICNQHCQKFRYWHSFIHCKP